MTTLDLKAAFLHVIDAHRWLAASGCAWNLVGPSAKGGTKTEAARLLPNIDVMIRDCLLLHARSLIKLYRNVRQRNTDIILADFGIPAIDPPLNAKLEQFEHAIEVHSFHLTDWRDVDYRSLNTAGPGATRGRPDWNLEADVIVNLVFDALKYVAGQKTWQQPFKDLYEACTARYRDKSFTWPVNLCEKSDVDQYLKGLGL